MEGNIFNFRIFFSSQKPFWSVLLGKELERSCFLETETASHRVVGQNWRDDWDKVILTHISITQASWRMLRKTKPDHSVSWPSVKVSVHLLSKGASQPQKDMPLFGEPWRVDKISWNPAYSWVYSHNHWGIFLQRSSYSMASQLV